MEQSINRELNPSTETINEKSIFLTFPNNFMYELLKLVIYWNSFKYKSITRNDFKYKSPKKRRKSSKNIDTKILHAFCHVQHILVTGRYLTKIRIILSITFLYEYKTPLTCKIFYYSRWGL